MHDRMVEFYCDQQRHYHPESRLKRLVIQRIESAVENQMVGFDDQAPECRDDHDRSENDQACRYQAFKTWINP